ncbi:hypothetical protein HHX47_DHR1001071 [Lentinula edodes]|nr:hypothetical protein HHX47_DHR1001071 [Lentinula edodes]
MQGQRMQLQEVKHDGDYHQAHRYAAGYTYNKDHWWCLLFNSTIVCICFPNQYHKQWNFF